MDNNLLNRVILRALILLFVLSIVNISIDYLTQKNIIEQITRNEQEMHDAVYAGIRDFFQDNYIEIKCSNEQK